ncbi:unnamed protein product [Caenorhabditis angaria]|uniref:Uncharacterized protein n=1 Tax=Caenorhabditis angaria TaxID=860376 RepID=A0A9P1N9X5_9PELO|nr:unnamed protein product [Caenorhabditis angaria]
MCQLKVMQQIMEVHLQKNYKKIEYECIRRIIVFLSRRLSQDLMYLGACGDYGFIRHKYRFKNSFEGFPFFETSQVSGCSRICNFY